MNYIFVIYNNIYVNVVMLTDKTGIVHVFLLIRQKLNVGVDFKMSPNILFVWFFRDLTVAGK